MACNTCNKTKPVQDNNVQKVLDVSKKAISAITVLTQGGNVEHGLRRAKVCVECEFSTYEKPVFEAESDSLLDKAVAKVETLGSEILDNFQHSDSKKIIILNPKTKGLYCGECGCAIAKKVLSKIEIKKLKNGSFNDKQIQSEGCPLNIWFHSGVDKMPR